MRPSSTAQASHARIDRRDGVLSLGLYATATASFVAADALFLAHGSVGDIAEWVRARTVLLLGIFIVTFGIDQALLRRPLPLRRIALPVLVQATVGSTVLILGFLPVIGYDVPWSTAAAVGCVSVLIVGGGYLRSQFYLARSQLLTNGWRVVALFAVAVAATRQAPTSLTASFVMQATALGAPLTLIALIGTRFRYHSDTTGRYLDLAPLASRFGVLGVVAAGLSYIDHFALALSASDVEIATYFRYLTLFMTGSIFVTSASAQVINPYVRSRQNELPRLHTMFMRFMMFGSIGLLVVSATVGLALNQLIGGPNLDAGWMLGALVLGILRFLYLMPSSLVGVVGTTKLLDRLVISSSVLVPLQLLLYGVLVARGRSPVTAMLVAALAAQALRLAASLRCQRLLMAEFHPTRVRA